MYSESKYHHDSSSNGSGDGGHFSRKREFSQENGSQDRGRKRRSRWAASEGDKVIIPGMPTVLPKDLTPEQEKIYLLQLQIEEISHRLRSGNLGIPQNVEERSPSPEPIYGSDGKRLNTREYRVRKRLEEDRHQHIQKMIELNNNYKPPADYKPPQTKISDKVFIPQEQYPDINFVGLLIGPRGNTLKAMERDTGAKIVIRGKGSVKDGKVGRKDGQPQPGEDEPLHAHLTAATEAGIQAATKEINKIVRQAIELPENQNNLRRSQLRELALLNGTLRENDTFANKICSNCGSHEHRNWQCPEKTNMVNSITCHKCGGRGHLQRDCKFEGTPGMEGEANQSKIDEEYLSLMAELGEAPLPSIKPPTQPVTTEIPDSESNSQSSVPSQSVNNHINSPGDMSATSPSDSSDGAKVKNVTWIQKQGSWKQFVKEVPTTSDQTGATGSTQQTNTTTSISAATMDPAAYYAAYGKHLGTSGQMGAGLDPSTQYAYSYYGYGTPGASATAGYPAVDANSTTSNPYANYSYGYNYAAYYAAAAAAQSSNAPPLPPDSSAQPPPPPSSN